MPAAASRRELGQTMEPLAPKRVEAAFLWFALWFAAGLETGAAY